MHPTHDHLVLHYYGESGDDTARLDLHLASCAECRGALQRLQQALALVEASGEGEPGAGYEATMWARLQNQLLTPAPWWQRLWQGGAARWAVAAAMAGVAAIAFYAGRQGRDVVEPTPAVATSISTAAAAAEAPARARLLDLAVGDHLVRAQLVLTEVANGASDDAGAALASERQRATDLVATNRLVRQTAALAGDDSLDVVLDDLERVLVEIANAPDDATADDWTALKARIETQSLLFRVRVLTDELRARQRPETNLRKGPTS